jgi:hypothetical protein
VTAQAHSYSPEMRTRVVCAITCGAVTALLAASPAAAIRSDPIVAPPSPTPAVVLGELEGLTGTSIAAATNAPDTGYTPVPASKTFGTGDTAAQEEGNTRVVEGQLASEVVISAQGARSVAKITAHICPDPGGLVTLDITMIVGSATSDDRTIEANARGHADDGAHLTSPSVSVVKGKGSDADRLTKLGLAVLRQAETAWRNGYCVKVEVANGASRPVKPQEAVAISATAKPRFGTGTISGRLESKLTAGHKKVAPTAAAGTPAKFTYTAPDKSPDTGSVELRSVSKRGIGIANLEYTTEGDLMVDATFSEIWHLKGVKCAGPGGEWDLVGTLVDVPSGSGDELFIANLDPATRSGPWHTSGEVAAGIGSLPFNESGTARYTAGPDGGTGSLDFGSGSVPVTSGTFCKDGQPIGG